ncbi:MAG: lamin tail domain-containing protein [bacterium]
MKKLFALTLTLMSVFALTACNDETTPSTSESAAQTVLNSITVQTTAEEDFTLETAKDDVTITWTSSNAAIAISGSKATVTQGESDVDVTLTAKAVKGDDEKTKDFSVKVLKLEKVIVTTIADALTSEDGTTVELSHVTVLKSYTSGTHFTDGTNVIYAYGTKSLTEGDSYSIVAEKASYAGSPQVKSAVITKLDGVESKTIEPTVATVAQINAVTDGLDYKYYTVTGTVDASGVFLVDGDDMIAISSYSQASSTTALKLYNGLEVTINIFLTGGYKDYKEVLTYVTEEELANLDISDSDRVNAAMNVLTITNETMIDLELPLVGSLGTTITWTSNNEAVLAADGTVNRQSVDTDVTLTASFTLGEVTSTKDYVVTVISSEQTTSTDVFISEYYEGKSNDKYIELYNPTSSAVDLSIYKLHMYSNDNVTGTNITLPSSIPAYGCVIIYNTSSSATIKELLADMIADGTAITGGVAHNGDDRFALLKNENIIDVFGVLEVRQDLSFPDGGSSVDHSVIRLEGYGASTTWNTSEWKTTSVDDDTALNNLGIHTFTNEVSVNLIEAVLENKQNNLVL